MARALIIGLTTGAILLTGCGGIDTGRSQLIPPQVKDTMGATTAPQDMSEADIIEKLTLDRQAYIRDLKMLAAYYAKIGNNIKWTWVNNELEAVRTIPQYNYIIGAMVAGPDLSATTSITEADYMYDDALRTEARARELLVVKDNDLLRVALAKYNQLIRKHPASDKIDDAAYKAAGIYEDFKDYTLALLYYQRAYQWNPDFSKPARFKRAYIMDNHYSRRAEALELYRESIAKERLSEQQRGYAQRRINQLTTSGEPIVDGQ